MSKRALIGLAVALLLTAVLSPVPGPGEAGTAHAAAAGKRCIKKKKRHQRKSKLRRCAKPKRKPARGLAPTRPATAPPAAPATTPPWNPLAPDTDPIATSTSNLSGRKFWTYSSGSTGSLDKTLHLCEGGRFLYVSSFVSTYVEGSDPSSYDHPYGETRATGRWRVASTTPVENQRKTTIVEYTTDDGQTGRLEFVSTVTGLFIDGLLTESGRPAVCA
jgi:hypothetical protein